MAPRKIRDLLDDSEKFRPLNIDQVQAAYLEMFNEGAADVKLSPLCHNNGVFENLREGLILMDAKCNELKNLGAVVPNPLQLQEQLDTLVETLSKQARCTLFIDSEVDRQSAAQAAAGPGRAGSCAPDLLDDHRLVPHGRVLREQLVAGDLGG